MKERIAMKRYVSFLLSAAFLLSTVTACANEQSAEPITNETNYTSGNLRGFYNKGLSTLLYNGSGYLNPE